MTKLGDILKLAKKQGGTIEFSIRVKNGKIVKEDQKLFEALSLTGESDEPIFKIVGVTNTKISIEVSHGGICNMVDEITRLESGEY